MKSHLRIIPEDQSIPYVPKKNRVSRLIYSVIGVTVFIAVWGFSGTMIFKRTGYEHFSGFLPLPSLKALMDLVQDRHFWVSVITSLKRILMGISIAFLIGFPMGLVTGFYTRLRIAAYLPVQFLRMISPLAWMPIALLVFDEFESAICFLIAISTIWPIFLNTIFAVLNVDRQWIKMAINQGATDWQLIRYVILPALIPQTVSSLRLSLGVAWIVLVPAEFLGVSSGLGYLINDARDIMEYDRLMAIVISIGLIGFMLDGVMQIAQGYFSGLIWRRTKRTIASLLSTSITILSTISLVLKEKVKTLSFWIVLDIIYIALIFALDHPSTCSISCGFFMPHIYGIFVGTMVMFTGIGAGVLWFPFLTHLGFAPTEIVPISLFNQIMGKGSGSFKYFNDDLLEPSVVKYFIPYTLIGVLIGFLASFIIPSSHEKWLYIIFVLVVTFLLVKIIRHTPLISAERGYAVPKDLLKKSRYIVLVSSIFTGLLSIGNSDWLIPYMESRFKLPYHKAVATGIFVMFCAAVFYLLLTIVTEIFGGHFLPDDLYILFATCSGVILGGQIGSRLILINWLRRHQHHAFIIMMSLSAMHITWEFILTH